SETAAFWDNDGRTLERLAPIVAKAVSQAMQSAGKAVSVLERVQTEPAQSNKNAVLCSSDISEPALEASETGRTVTLFATGILAVVFAVWLTAPWMVEAMNSLVSPPRSQAATTAPAAVDYSDMTI